MKIRSVKFWKEDLQLTRPYTIAYKTVSAVDNVFVLLEAENGLYGIGAGSPAAFVTNESMEDTLGALGQHLEALTLGRDLRQYQAILRESVAKMPDCPAARAALDIALYDLFTKYLDIPLVDFFGRVHAGIPTSVTIGINDLETTLAQADEYVADGFRVIKLKTGNAVEKDIEIFRKLRERVGPEVKIRVDANQGYQQADLVRFLEACRDAEVEFVEQPLPRGAYAQLRDLPWEVRALCAADEDLQIPKDAVTLAAEPLPYGIYNIKLMKCGGVDAGKKIADVAYDRQIDLMWGCMDESIVSITAALHIALASPATRYLDLDGSFDLARDLVRGGFELKDGCLWPLDKPGLGVERLEQ
ncbi:mandelate racemase/muconate lactonizing enzyme family protein [Flavilitoribacter nigricans]|uniref:Dipeptide epimerase n=1 Tax=Flavilitoribacter nigricans (strain ATCC 23147 / DSM 23189 / NBRC 102662 / NCIMB 1420 / SS-2) TaxID=1122177 RepID=A0A2D0N4G4_FLAN2|nr:dipeptide epimerase [Flavilitoribacter nigricans]PHN03276.1 dipeptide epimerase [Flavilitoribacter nigricans DSM 23189 = NBRC 102662]